MFLFFWLYDHTVVPVHYRIMAVIRFILFVLLQGWMSFDPYDDPVAVGGFNGVYLLGGRAIVFERIDGSNQYLW